MIEAALSLPILLFFLLFIIDLGRYFFIFLILNYAAYSAVDLSTKLEFESNINLSCNCAAEPESSCCGYQERLRRVMERALSTANLVASSSGNVESKARLQSFAHYHSLDYTGDMQVSASVFEDVPVIYDVAILRPGEKARRHIPPPGAGEDEYVNHSTRAFPEVIPSSGLGWPQGGETWLGVLAAHPLEVRLEVLFEPVTPFFPSLRIAASQLGFRKTGAFGGVPPQIDMPPTNTPQPTATPTPTGTPIPPPTATPTPGCAQCLSEYSSNYILLCQFCAHCNLSCADCFEPCLATGETCQKCASSYDPAGVCEPCPTPTPTTTSTPTNTPTNTPTPTGTPGCNDPDGPCDPDGSAYDCTVCEHCPSPACTPTPTPTTTNTPTATSTPTATGTPTNTPTTTPTPTATATPTSTPDICQSEVCQNAIDGGFCNETDGHCGECYMCEGCQCGHYQ